jgi:hypothetical protein
MQVQRRAFLDKSESVIANDHPEIKFVFAIVIQILKVIVFGEP